MASRTKGEQEDNGKREKRGFGQSGGYGGGGGGGGGYGGGYGGFGLF